MVTGRDKVEQVLQAGTVECLDPCHPSQTKVESTPQNSESSVSSSLPGHKEQAGKLD